MSEKCSYKYEPNPIAAPTPAPTNIPPGHNSDPISAPAINAETVAPAATAEAPPTMPPLPPNFKLPEPYANVPAAPELDFL